MVVLAPTLARQFAYTVDRGRLADRALRGHIPGRGGTEDRDAAGPVHFLDLPFARQLQDDEQALHVKLPRERGILLRRCAEKRGKQVDLGNAVFVDDAFDTTAIRGIDHGEGEIQMLQTT